MEEAGLKIKITADVRNALLNIANLTDATGELAVEGVGNITAINEALAELRKAQKDVGDPKDLATVNRAIKDLGKESQRLRNVGVSGFNELGEKIKDIEPAAQSAGKGLAGAANSAYGAVRKIAQILPGIGIAGIFGLIGSAILEAGDAMGLFTGDLFKTSLAEKRAAEDAKHLADVLLKLRDAGEISLSSGAGEEGNIDRVRALAAAVQDTNKTYQERKNALDQLRETNKAYFGDLTLEAASLATLSKRVQEYSNALIAEAIVKGQVEEIAKISEEYVKQEKILQKLKTARDQALAAQANTKITPTGGGTGTVGGTNISEETQLARAVSRTEAAWQKQREAVLDLSTAIAASRGELDKAIAQQIQYKPLKDVKETVDKTGKSIESLLEKIKRAQDELSRPDRAPLFKQLGESLLPDDRNGVSLLRQKIVDAIAEGNKLGTDRAKSLAKELGDLYEQQIKRIQNPDLKSRVDFTLADPADVTKAFDKLESQVTKEFGKKLDLKVPTDIKLALSDVNIEDSDRKALLNKAERDAAANLPVIRWAPKVQVIVDAKTIADDTLLQFNKAATQILRGITESGLSEIGIAIGDAFSGKGLDNALKDFSQILGNGLIAIGKELIIASGIIKTIRVALDHLFENPLIGIAVGIGAIAIGEVLKNSVKNTGAHAFATGGIVTGPTLGLVGEKGPEVIFPLNQLNRFIQGTRGAPGQDINVRGMISGNNIRLALARSNKQQGLV